MKLTKLTTALALTTVMVATQAGVVRADEATATSPTPTPVVETRTECTTGAYGQQTCKTVEVKKVLGATTPKKAEVKQAGAAENILFGSLGLMALSVFGLAYSRQK